MSAPAQGATHARLPGSASEGESKDIEQKLLLSGYSTTAATRLVHRFGARAAAVLEVEEGYAPVPKGQGSACLEGITVGEVQLTLKTEKVRCFEDLMRRRLEIELLPGHGLEFIEEVAEMYREWAGISEEALQKEVTRYRERMKVLDDLLQ